MSLVTCFSDELRSFSLLHKSAADCLLSIDLSDLCKSFARAVATKALSFFSIMDFYSTDDDYDVSDFCRPPQRPRLRDDGAEPEPKAERQPDDEKVYLVPYRWWKEVQRPADSVEGVSYDVSFDTDNCMWEIVMNLRKIEDYKNQDFAQEFKEYALVTELMWVRAFRRHEELDATRKKLVTFTAEDFLSNVFPLQIKLLVSSKTNSLVVKIHEKDNTIDSYRRACNIFSSESKLLHIWDFSGKITKILMNESLPRLLRLEYLLQLQVYGFTDSNEDRDDRDDEMDETDSIIGGSGDGTDKLESSLTQSNSSQYARSYRGAGSLGLIGLCNLGNTCFMNSSIQCLAHTPELVDYFLGDYGKEINSDNPWGGKGDLALAFGELLRMLWVPGTSPVAPSMLMLKIENYSSQFIGYQQHDSQEFLAFLLDGLHEDLNRVMCKLPTEAKDTEGRPNEEVAGEHWKNHLAQNDSIIVDLFHGQYRSTVACSVCNWMSVTFEPFVYLSLPIPSTATGTMVPIPSIATQTMVPIPSTAMRSMVLNVLSTDGASPPSTITINVPENGRLEDLIDALSKACSLNDDETLLVAEVYYNRIFRLLEDLKGLLSLIRNDDCLVAYRLPRESSAFPLVEFMHQRREKQFIFGGRSDPTIFGIPFVARLSDLHHGYDLREHYTRILDPFSISIDNASNDPVDDAGNNANEDNEIDDATSATNFSGLPGSENESGDDAGLDVDFQFYIGGELEDTLIEMSEPVLAPEFPESLKVLVLWSDKMTKKYDTSRLGSLPVVFMSHPFSWSSQDPFSLHKCLADYLEEELLGEGDVWYCPNCERRQQAKKKLDFWKLPEILVVHLKRFSFTQGSSSKLERYVDFPIDDLDFSTYLTRKDVPPNRYHLYAIINHSGSASSGHYTAFVRIDDGFWFEFDDSYVRHVSVESIKTAAAYVLFYRRVPDAETNTVV